MVAVKTSIEDMRSVLGYLNKQIGWVEVAKVNKTLGSIDERKLRAMSEFGLIERDGGNVRLGAYGTDFAGGDEAGALQAVILSVELYRATVEWIHYGARSEVSAIDIGQYWEAHHRDTVGELKGTTLNDGAVTFGRVVQGAGLGKITLGRGGRPTRLAADLPAIQRLVEYAKSSTATAKVPDDTTGSDTLAPDLFGGRRAVRPVDEAVSAPPQGSASAGPVHVTTSPSVHVNVEIHIAADATPETVRDIFRNMALYVLDKPVRNDGDV